MVGIIIRILFQSLKEVTPRLETLRSYLIEACNIMNARPLTHIPVSSSEEAPLTPNHFFLRGAKTIQEFSEVDEQFWTLKKSGE